MRFSSTIGGNLLFSIKQIELAFQRKRVTIDRSRHRENAVEVVALVLKQL